MPNPRQPRVFAILLALAVVLPLAIGLGLLVHSVHTDDAWYGPESGFAWFGAFVFTPVLVLIAAAACRAAARRDVEAYQATAGFFALVAALMTLSLIEAAAVALGWKDGQVPTTGLLFVSGSWLYSLLMALGHWWFARPLRSKETNREAFPA